MSNEKTEFLDMAFEIKSAEKKQKPDGSNIGVVVAYAAAFDNLDFGNDIIKKGAFKKSIKEKKGKWPILANHSPWDHIGYNVKAEEDDKGLLVEEEFNLDVVQGLEKYSLTRQALDNGIKIGRSIGYRAIKFEIEERDGERIRILKELQIFEHSAVTFPMNDKAFALQAKEWKEKLENGGTKELLDYWIKEVGEKQALEIMKKQIEALEKAASMDDDKFEKPDIVIHSLRELNKLF